MEIIINGVAHKIKPLEWEGASNDDGEYHEWTTKRNDMQFEIIGEEGEGYEVREQYCEIDWTEGFSAEYDTIEAAKAAAEQRHVELVMANFEQCQTGRTFTAARYNDIDSLKKLRGKHCLIGNIPMAQCKYMMDRIDEMSSTSPGPDPSAEPGVEVVK